MKISRGILVASLAFGLLAGCISPPEKKDYSKFRAENVRSILVVPVVNNTVSIEAPNYFLSTVSIPIAERGYYIFPVNLVKQVMDAEGLSDANLVHSASPTRLAEMFGADSVLYISIERWETTYLVLSATTTVSFTYVLKSGRTGEELWRESSTMQYTPNSGGGGGVGGLIAMAVSAAIQKAAPNYMPLARQANARALYTVGQGIPAGPYHKEFGKDKEKF